MYIEQKQQLYQTENGAYISEEKVGCHLVNQRLSSGQPSIDKGRLDKVSIDKGSIEQASPFSLYGEYKNIRLTDEEYQKLKDRLKGHTDTMIEKLSRYIKGSGKDYKDHYVTILNWYEQDKEKLTQKNIQNKSSKTYSTNYEDSDSL